MNIAVGGLTSTVTYSVSMAPSGLTVITVSAICGQSSSTHSITVGSVDGNSGTPPTTADLQTALDNGRQQVANEAIWRESARVAATQLV